VNEIWRDSQVQVIAPGIWTKLNGTDAEILIPEAAEATLIRVRSRHQAGGGGGGPANGGNATGGPGCGPGGGGGSGRS
jgi:hypothetical protein